MNKTRIEFLTHSWNPLAMRCTPISEGCAHCWHLRMANRLAGNVRLAPEVRAAYRGDSKPMLVQSRLGEPDPRGMLKRIGVQLMGDLFHPDVLPAMRWAVFGTIGRNWQQAFCILTKRPEAMRAFILDLVMEIDFFIGHWRGPYAEARTTFFPNLMLGVSVENQQRANERIPALLDTPAAVHFISAEPLLGPVDLGKYFWSCPEPDLDWVIAGAETGPSKRPMDLDWARALRDACVEAGVPFFFKRDGSGRHELDGRVWEEMPEVRKR